MRENLLSSAIKQGTWYKLNNRTDLITEIERLIQENYCFEFNVEKTMFRKIPNCLFTWAQGREDCNVVTRKLGYGKICYDLYQGNKLLATR